MINHTYLWGPKGRFLYLFIASAILLLTFLGTRDLWTQEHRWADIVFGMFYRHDFLHPYLGTQAYYDKPLLSYWLMVCCAKALGGLTPWALRLPSALAGLLAIGSIYHLGCLLKDRTLGLLAGWLLLTTFYFVFWARVSSADMLNLAGSLFAVTWYYAHREATTFSQYTVFFVILALTALCKGLIGMIIPVIAVVSELCLRRQWKQHMHGVVWGAWLVGVSLYLLPFILSHYTDHVHYQTNGLYLVYRENILRYFHPFDHQGPMYTYFIYLPLYLLPWTIFFIPACFSAIRSAYRTHALSWMTWTVLGLFLFLTLSGSRRNYYILPVIPFAILMTAEWLVTTRLREVWVSGLVVGMSVVLWIGWDMIPALHDRVAGASAFATLLKQETYSMKPWHEWSVVSLNAESKLFFYLSLPPNTPHYDLIAHDNLAFILSHSPSETIFITRASMVPLLANYFEAYRVVRLRSTGLWGSTDEPVAFVPPLNLKKLKKERHPSLTAQGWRAEGRVEAFVVDA